MLIDKKASNNMTHDPLCLEGLSDWERENVVSGIDPERCDFCILIAKVREDALSRALFAVEEAVGNRIVELFSCNKSDDCWIKAEGADIAMDDAVFVINELRRNYSQ